MYAVEMSLDEKDALWGRAVEISGVKHYFWE